MKGAERMFTALGGLGEGWGAVAVAEGAATEATGALATAVGALDAVMAPLLGTLAAVAAAGGALFKATDAFSESEASLARTALQLHNLKGSIPIGELVEFADHMQDLTGINHDVIASLGATASQFGETKSQIEKLIPTVLDIAQAKELDPASVLNKLLRAGNRPQGLIALGIDPAKVHGDLHDINTLVDQIGKGFAGVATGFRDTLPGSLNALESAWSRSEEAVGRLFSPAVVPILNGITHVLDAGTRFSTLIADALHLPTAANLGLGGGASDIALKGDPEQTKYQRETAENTRSLNDAFVKNVLGGPGTAARAAFTARDARLAFGI